jgi:hypothetical protein
MINPQKGIDIMNNTSIINRILFAVTLFQHRFMQEPHELHWKVAKRILKYIQGTVTFGIHYAIESTMDLIEFTDSNCVGDNIDHKYTFGYSLSLGSGPIYWSSKKHASISLYLVEVEYKGVINITIHDMWIQHFITKLGIQFHRLIVIWCDNQSTLKFFKD